MKDGLALPTKTASRQLSHGALAAEHDGISSIQDRVGDVARLRTGRERLVLHGRQHLRGTDGVLAGCLKQGAKQTTKPEQSALPADEQTPNLELQKPKVCPIMSRLFALGPQSRHYLHTRSPKEDIACQQSSDPEPITALVFLSIIFWAIQTFSMGISMPRSPRATMMPSDSARILGERIPVC